MQTVLAVIARPLFLLALLGTAFCVSRAVERFIPAGRIKALLYRSHRLAGPAKSPTEQRIARAVILIAILLVLFKPFSYL